MKMNNFETIMDAIPQGICIVKKDNKILYANKYFLTLLAADEVYSLNEFLLEPLDLESFTEFRLINKNNEIRWISGEAKKILWNDQPVVLLSCQDITKNKEVLSEFIQLKEELKKEKINII